MLDQELSTLALKNARELIVITIWYLWWDRCKLIHEGKFEREVSNLDWHSRYNDKLCKYPLP